MGEYYGVQRTGAYLQHYGVKGMRWGVRKAPGSSGKRTFVSGSSKTQDKASPYYRRKLPKYVRQQLKAGMRNGDSFIVGDAPGIDRQVQDYLKKKHYPAVDVYGPGKKVRYSADQNWKTHPIDSKYPEGSEQWLAKKDRVMTKDATDGLAVILNKGSSATKNNITRMQKSRKPMKIYELHEGEGLIKGLQHPNDQEVITWFEPSKKNNGRFQPGYRGVNRYYGGSNTSMTDWANDHHFDLDFRSPSQKRAARRKTKRS